MNKEEDSGKLSNSLDSVQMKQVLLRGGGIQAIWSGGRETNVFSLYYLLLHSNITTNLVLLIGCTYYLTVSLGQEYRNDLAGSSVQVSQGFSQGCNLIWGSNVIVGSIQLLVLPQSGP